MLIVSSIRRAHNMFRGFFSVMAFHRNLVQVHTVLKARQLMPNESHKLSLYTLIYKIVFMQCVENVFIFVRVSIQHSTCWRVHGIIIFEATKVLFQADLQAGRTDSPSVSQQLSVCMRLAKRLLVLFNSSLCLKTVYLSLLDFFNTEQLDVPLIAVLHK